MIMKNLLKINWSNRIGRLDLFRANLVAVLIVFASVVIIAAGSGAMENPNINEFVGFLIMLVGLVPLLYAFVLKISLVVRRVRDIAPSMGNAGVGVSSIVFFVLASMIPFFGLVLLLWPGKKEEAIAA